MVDWLRFAARVAAALVVGFLGLSFLFAAAIMPERQLVTAAIGGVMLIGGWLSWPKRPNAWRHDPPTDRQVDYALDLGIDIPANVTKGQLSDMIEQARRR